MTCLIYFENNLFKAINYEYDLSTLKTEISLKYGVSSEDLFAIVNGKSIPNHYKLNDESVVRVFTRLVGGKGGFGSMLRAIGAQIEKTTNREACRDLSGRRLRDINEEKRLRKWLEGQEEREKEAADRKQKKIERLIAEPKIYVNLSPVYEKECQELPERVSAAVDAGWNAAGTSSSSGVKRKSCEEDKTKQKKKAKLWIDADLSDCSSVSDDDDDDDDEQQEEAKSTPGPTLSVDSGNESDRLSETSSKV